MASDLSLPFEKVQGTGNDFVLFDGFATPLPIETLTRPEVARALCDRHFGIGSDGLLLLLPPTEAGQDARMRIINADGSEAEMCGNGIRCLARCFVEDHPAQDAATDLRIGTLAGVRQCQIRRDPAGGVAGVRVDMGQPRFEPEALGLDRSQPLLEEPLVVDGRSLVCTAVSMGNPHLVHFVDSDEDLHQMALAIGPVLERHPLFAHRTNVEFARFDEGNIELWVWERGCGLTLACGTGACATAAAAVRLGLHPVGVPVSIRLPGGSLSVEVDREFARAVLDGPAERVFRGEVSMAGLPRTGTLDDPDPPTSL